MTTNVWLWLLLPLAAVLGWLIRDRAIARDNGRQINQFSTSYFRGLNYLLNEQPDKAIEVFLQIAEVDKNTVETHLALGNLFRRRGEVDRAIRFHQNLISRTGLSPKQRTQALLELGEDYMRAGLLDRAERLFSELIELEAHTPSALQHLVSIYEQERDWEECIEHAKKLELVSHKDMSPTIAQYHCELAQEALVKGDDQTAKEHLQRAIKTDKRCVRASLIEGRMAHVAGDYAGAIGAYRRVAEQDMDYIPDVLEPVLKSYQASDNQADARSFLEDITDRYRGISPVLALADMIEKDQGRKPAADFIGQQLKRRPSVRGLDHLIGLNLSDSEGDARENLLILSDLTAKLLAGQPIYRCNHCGFGTKSNHWQCPSCKNWSTVKPIHGVAGE